MDYGSVSAPAGGAFTITPSDSTILRATALYVGGAGNVSVEMEDTSEVVFVGVAAGTILPLRVRRVKAATTATSIVGLRP